MEPITNPQIQKLHCLYRNLGITDSKEMLKEFTKGRTDSTKGLGKEEATRLIGSLTGDDGGEKKRRMIYQLAFKAGILYGDTAVDKQLNAAKLDMFLKERGTVKKALNKLTVPELGKVHKQMEAIVKSNAAGKDNKAAKTATDKLLNELNITVSKK